MFRQTQALQTILNAVEAAATGSSINVEQYRNIILAFDTASSANGTTKIQGSVADTCPDFSAAQSVSNQWDYVACKDLQDESSIAGDVGLVVSGTDDHRQVEVNTNGLKWLCATITAQSAGAITLKAKVYSE